MFSDFFFFSSAAGTLIKNPKKLPLANTKKSLYVYKVKKNLYMQFITTPLKGCGLGSFINALGNANCAFRPISFGKTRFVVAVVALDEIQSKTELSISYNCSVVPRTKITESTDHTVADVSAKDVETLSDLL